MKDQTFFDAYVNTALWLLDESPGAGEWAQHDNYTVANIEPATLAKMAADCAEFEQEQYDTLQTVYLFGGNYDETYGGDYDEVNAGHDFWLSRNGHGAGFFDRGEQLDWTYLQNAAKERGEYDLYMGDDGVIYGG